MPHRKTITVGAWTVHRDRPRLSFSRYPIAQGRTLTIIRIGPACFSRYPEPATARTVAQLHNTGAAR
jgi:hypothetical protein